MRIGLIVLSCLALSGCAIFEDVMSPDAGGPSNVAANADAQSLSDLMISNGRYSVMLGQAREILKLPEPKAPSGDAGTAAGESQERAQLAKSQVQVIEDLLADTANACQKRKLPKGVKATACSQQKRVGADLRTAAADDLPSLSARNDAVGAVVMDWWNTVCATAPKAKPGEPSACSIE